MLVTQRRGEQQAEALEKQLASGEMLKCYCDACGGHILSSAANLGQKVDCPHCQANTTLRRPDKVKMPCFFCGGKIEFPNYAAGTKIQCPHCHKDITLKETSTPAPDAKAK